MNYALMFRYADRILNLNLLPTLCIMTHVRDDLQPNAPILICLS